MHSELSSRVRESRVRSKLVLNDGGKGPGVVHPQDLVTDVELQHIAPLQGIVRRPEARGRDKDLVLTPEAAVHREVPELLVEEVDVGDEGALVQGRAQELEELSLALGTSGGQEQQACDLHDGSLGRAPGVLVDHTGLRLLEAARVLDAEDAGVDVGRGVRGVLVAALRQVEAPGRDENFDEAVGAQVRRHGEAVVGGVEGHVRRNLARVFFGVRRERPNGPPTESLYLKRKYLVVTWQGLQKIFIHFYLKFTVSLHFFFFSD